MLRIILNPMFWVRNASKFGQAIKKGFLDGASKAQRQAENDFPK